jgi:hypothetical protein
MPPGREQHSSDLPTSPIPYGDPAEFPTQATAAHPHFSETRGGPFGSPVGWGVKMPSPLSTRERHTPPLCHFFGGWHSRRIAQAPLPSASSVDRGWAVCQLPGGMEARPRSPFPRRPARACVRPDRRLALTKNPETGVTRQRLSSFVELSFGRNAVTIQIGTIQERRSRGANTKAANVDGRLSIPWSSRPSSMSFVDR